MFNQIFYKKICSCNNIKSFKLYENNIYNFYNKNLKLKLQRFLKFEELSNQFEISEHCNFRYEGNYMIRRIINQKRIKGFTSYL